jgi:hypothetical protein
VALDALTTRLERERHAFDAERAESDRVNALNQDLRARLEQAEGALRRIASLQSQEVARLIAEIALSPTEEPTRDTDLEGDDEFEQEPTRREAKKPSMCPECGNPEDLTHLSHAGRGRERRGWLGPPTGGGRP